LLWPPNKLLVFDAINSEFEGFNIKVSISFVDLCLFDSLISSIYEYSSFIIADLSLNIDIYDFSTVLLVCCANALFLIALFRLDSSVEVDNDDLDSDFFAAIYVGDRE